MKKTVSDYIKKYKIDVNTLRIYDESLEDEIYDVYEIKEYAKAVVVNAYKHNGAPVLQVKHK